MYLIDSAIVAFPAIIILYVQLETRIPVRHVLHNGNKGITD